MTTCLSQVPLHHYSVRLFSINQENGSIDVEPSFDGIREDCVVIGGYGNGRMIGFVADGITDVIVTVANLDYPGVTVEVDCLGVYTTEVVSGYWTIVIPIANFF